MALFRNAAVSCSAIAAFSTATVAAEMSVAVPVARAWAALRAVRLHLDGALELPRR